MYDYFDIKSITHWNLKKVAESTWAQETQNGVPRRLTRWLGVGSEKERIHAFRE